MEPIQGNHPTEDRYFYHQIIGLRVITTGGETVGDIVDILEGQSNDNYIVHGPRGEVFIPAIEDVVRSIDLKKGIITIEAIDGLLDLNEKRPPK
jgi:16S rRNA processing protein RimM